MTLLLHVLMLSLLSGGSARVVKNFEQECGKFFANGKSPTTFTGLQYKQICQTLNGVVYYATYYDTGNKIPVYSAYKFEGRMSCKRPNNWYIEPQLDEDNDDKPNMATEGAVKQGLRGKRQALSEDYENSTPLLSTLLYSTPWFHRGHLAPVYQAGSQSCADATFTLTNAAPQNSSFNSGQWRVLESNITKNLTEECLPKQYNVYIVTGVVPGTKKMNTVIVPSHFWTAYCCLDQNNKCKISRGFIGVNENKTPKNITVNELERELKNLYQVTSFEVFDSSSEPPAKKQKIEHSK